MPPRIPNKKRGGRGSRGVGTARTRTKSGGGVPAKRMSAEKKRKSRSGY